MNFPGSRLHIFLLSIGFVVSEIPDFNGRYTAENIQSYVSKEIATLELSEGQKPRHLYLRLLRDTVAGVSIGESEKSLVEEDGVLVERRLDLELRKAGEDWPWLGTTRIGLRRLHVILQALLNTAASGIQGDFVDTGVWRGGSSAFGFGVMLAYNFSTSRKVWVLDPFLPVSTGSLWADFRAFVLSKNQYKVCEYKKVGLETVRRNFYWMNLLDEERVRFVRTAYSGLHKSSLPASIAVLRVHGESYAEVLDILTNLYDRLSVGGWVILDDWDKSFVENGVKAFRRWTGISAAINVVDKHSAYWVKQKEQSVEKEMWGRERGLHVPTPAELAVADASQSRFIRWLGFLTSAGLSVFVNRKLAIMFLDMSDKCCRL